MAKRYEIITGDAVGVLKTLPQESIHCCITSPPYFGLRRYNDVGSRESSSEIGLEPTPDAYIANLVRVFRYVRRRLRDDGTLFVVIGDSYVRSPNKGGSGSGGKNHRWYDDAALRATRVRIPGLPTKNLVGIPWRLALALQADGWILRCDMIWCLSGGTRLYARTQKGDTPATIKDLTRLDPRTVKLWNGAKWTQVLGWGRSPTRENTRTLVLRSGERIACTAAHQWPTARGIVKAGDLQVGDILKTCQLSEPRNAKMPRYLTSGLLWLIGLYIAEGSHSGSVVQLSLHADEQSHLPKIAAAVSSIGATMRYTVTGNCLHVRMSGKILNAVLAEYVGGRTAHDKCLTARAWMLPNSGLDALMRGYLLGDGGADGNRTRLGFCRNYAWERDLRTLAARLGATLTLVPYMSKYQHGVKPAFKGEWRWHRSGHHNQKERSEIVEIRESSKARQFWDISVADAPHLFALSSGVLTHNCKPNVLPESVKDRPTRCHEYVFMLTKSPTYYYNADAIREPHQAGSRERSARARRPTAKYADGNSVRGPQTMLHSMEKACHPLGRNRRSVWTIPTGNFKGAHFATFPPRLVEPCLLAGCPEGGYVLDCFAGSGTTGEVALQHGRRFIGIELNPEFAAIADKRCADAL